MAGSLDSIVKQGRILFAIAILALGVEHLVCAHFGQAVVPVIPWVPGHPWLAYLTGIALIAAALSIAANKKARLAAILLAIFFLVCDFVLQVPKVVAHPLDIAIRTGAFEILAICAAALTLAGTLPVERPYPAPWESVVEVLIKSGLFLFAVCSVIFGIDHFLVLGFIASLVPAWIPGSGMFWAYLTAAAFVAAGVSMATKWMGRLAGILLGTMFLLWFLLLHSPRVMTYPRSHNPNEWSSAFIALGMCGGSWICAWALSANRRSSH
jgi:uncharacterized membrane protein